MLFCYLGRSSALFGVKSLEEDVGIRYGNNQYPSPARSTIFTTNYFDIEPPKKFHPPHETFLCRQNKTAEINAKTYFKHCEGP